MNRLQEKRLELGLTQPQVSARLKEVEARADVGMVSRYEKGVSTWWLMFLLPRIRASGSSLSQPIRRRAWTRSLRSGAPCWTRWR